MIEFILVIMIQGDVRTPAYLNAEYYFCSEKGGYAWTYEKTLPEGGPDTSSEVIKLPSDSCDGPYKFESNLFK